MKKIYLLLMGLLMLGIAPLIAQEKADSSATSEPEYYVITLSGTRLFEDMQNLSSVLLIIPKGEKVRIYEEYGEYYLAEYKGSAGYIRIDNTRFTEETEKELEKVWAKEQARETPEQPVSTDLVREEMMVKRYGETLGPKIAARAIWKGMNRSMVYDSWGKPSQIRRSQEMGRPVEVWYYRNVTLYFEDGELRYWRK